MIYIIGGPGKTGSSTISKRLAGELNAPRLYGGQYMRTEAMKAGYIKSGYDLPDDQALWDLDQANISGFRKNCKTNSRDIDKEMEMYLMQGMLDSVRTNSDVVIESKVMTRFLNSPVMPQFLAELNATHFSDPTQYVDPQTIIDNSKGVWLHSDIRTRAIRCVNKKNGNTTTPEGNPIPPSEKDITAAIDELCERQLVDGLDYASKYGMDDFPAANEAPNPNYGTIIDSSTQSPEQTYAQVKSVFGL